MTTRTIAVDYLARVEGEGALKLTIRDGHVEDAQLKIFEPPRYFEAFMVGRAAMEAPDIAARICGICPVAYQLSAMAAVEDAWDVTVPRPVVDLRRLLLCGEWIGSHGLHVILLHAPDFLGYPDAVTMAKDHGDAVRRGLAIKKAGNAIVDIVGGREIHPINVRVGGFYSSPPRDRMDALRKDIDAAIEAAAEAVDWVASFDVPDVTTAHERVAITTPGAYPMAPDRIASTEGLDIAPSGFEDTFVEEHHPHTTALHAKVIGRGRYLTGPMARLALSGDALNPRALEGARAAGMEGLLTNPYRSIAVRSVEVLHALEEAARLLADWAPTDRPYVDAVPRKATGHGVIEAPRGLLYQRYDTDAEGTVTAAKIVPPTSQNQASIEADLRVVADAFASASDDVLQHRCEQAIRNHDPCISCATHFLRLEVDRQ
ncbi:MAG: nickel-dependent hydrogenase large subunit [Devosia sp.]